MRGEACDVLVVGAGFAGSVLSQVLRRLGLSVVLIDRQRHPRFAIGESSTPLADFMLERLAATYELPHLNALARYGAWRKALPDVGRGLKRGFSYFHHNQQAPFPADPQHARQLLVAASSDAASSDTHWLRADVDAWLARQAVASGVELWEETTLKGLQRSNSGWDIQLQSTPLGRRRLSARFVCDASGSGVAARWIGVGSGPNCRTNTAAVFTHLRDVAAWSTTYSDGLAAAKEHPFPCDDAAQHHLLDGAWIWLLRFDDGLTSAGLVIDLDRHPRGSLLQNPQTIWRQWLDRYPSAAELFHCARLADVPGTWLATGRMQRRLACAAGPGWAALPNTVGFIDPLHSTGIAHSLWGVARCAHILREHWGRPSLAAQLAGYDCMVRNELHWIDQLISACYRCLPCFSLFINACMTYFAAATTLERRAQEHQRGPLPAFLCADDAALRQAADRLDLARPDPLKADAADLDAFAKLVRRELQPFNHVGLCDPQAHNMYRDTTAPHKSC